ncbi:hypothetical protein RvVAT039_pl10240 (plasmid) [Agrobacterium vitis]|nr:hypothetical protein RvVAT039_pl10240 [Agrobacterium vitis]
MARTSLSTNRVNKRGVFYRIAGKNNSVWFAGALTKPICRSAIVGGQNGFPRAVGAIISDQ